MQTAIAYSRLLRQMADRQRQQDKVHGEQRLVGTFAAKSQARLQSTAQEQAGPRR